jgi:DNA-binding HxlR family transcriptional regulator
VRAILQVYESLAERFGPGLEEKMGAVERPSQFTAEEAESVLDPLANAWRIKVLSALRRGDHGLTELGRTLDLKTGHLQFHLRALMEAGFVALDRRKHRYSLTDRGAVALSCAEDMVSKLGPTGPQPSGHVEGSTGVRRVADAC